MTTVAAPLSSFVPPSSAKNDEELRALCDELHALEQSLQCIELQTTTCKVDIRLLHCEIAAAKEELQRVSSVSLLVGTFHNMVTDEKGIVSATGETKYYVPVLSTLDREMLKPNSSVGLRHGSHACVAILPAETDSRISLMEKRPEVSMADVGDRDTQKQELREAVELPLTQGYLYKQIGIDPPRGVLLYGPPGTGKTMIVKAIARQTKCAFLKVSGSEFVQKYLGEGPRMVRDVFRLARENSPAIVFIDEVDAVGTKRFDAKHGADKEVQRILMQLLTEMDGFDRSNDQVKVLMATNRWDTLDPALLRPGRLDRKIEFPLPDRRQKRLIFQTLTSKMSVSADVDLEDFVGRPDRISGAEIASICTEAGMLAVRKNRYVVLARDLEKAYANVVKKSTTDDPFCR